MAFEVEDFARSALVRILPRSGYRLAAQNDVRFESFAADTTRITYRQQGATPAFLLFSGPGQNPRAAATAAAGWAEANWRPNAIQRTVRPGVVVVQVASGAELTNAGLVAGTLVPAAIWTVDSETGRVEVAASPPGSPSAAQMRRAAEALAQGQPAPSLGELGLAERALMETRRIAMPTVLGGTLGILLVLFLLSYGFGGLSSLFGLSTGASAGDVSTPGGKLLLFGGTLINVLILAGIVLGLIVYFNVGNLAFRIPGFSSPILRTRRLSWVGYAVLMVVLALVLSVVLAAEQSASQRASASQLGHVIVTAGDDGTEAQVAVGGDLTVDLSTWPPSEWSGIQFKTSNPSVLTLGALLSASVPPVARFTAREPGSARVNATSLDGRYTFELLVNVVT